MDHNSCMITGRIGDAVDVRRTKNGTAWAKVSVAVSGGRGEKEWTNWLKVETWGKLAERCGTMRKGSAVAVIGELKVNSWEAPDGGKRKETVIKANNVFINPSFDSKPAVTAHDTEPPARPTFGNDDDIPF